MLSVNGTAGDFQLQHSSMVHQVVGANPVSQMVKFVLALRLGEVKVTNCGSSHITSSCVVG